MPYQSPSIERVGGDDPISPDGLGVAFYVVALAVAAVVALVTVYTNVYTVAVYKSVWTTE